MMRISAFPIGAMALATALAGFSLPAMAQTFEDAVRGNFRLATDLCMRVMYRLEPSRAVFAEAGFTWFSVEGTVNSYGVKGQTRHYADAPANTVRVSINEPDQVSGLCRAFTAHLDVATAQQLVGETIAFRFPDADRREVGQWFVPTPGGLPLIVTVGSKPRSRFAEDTGTAEVSMSYPG